jgi:hypothetical protein
MSTVFMIAVNIPVIKTAQDLLPLDIFKGTVNTIFIEGSDLENIIPFQPIKFVRLGPGIIDGYIGIFCIGGFFIPDFITT